MAEGNPNHSAVVTPGTAQSDERLGFLLGFLGVAAFSVTLPATRVAVAYLDPAVVGLGRAIVAAVIAAVVLKLRLTPVPRGGEWARLVVVALGVVLGFPYLSAWAMQFVPSSHGGVVLGILPLATAAAGAVLVRERPSLGFWLAGTVGSMLVVVYSLWEGGGSIEWADLALLAAVIAAAIGYAEGARLSRRLGGLGVMSWALVISAPVLIVPVGWRAYETGLSAPPEAWLAFAYVAVISQYLAFYAWYRGLALGGIAKVGQVQLLQTFLTLGFAALLLNEEISWLTILFALLVVCVVAVGRRMPVARGGG